MSDTLHIVCPNCIANKNRVDSEATSSPTLRPEYEARLEAGEQLAVGSRASHTPEEAQLQRRVVDAQRQVLLDLREREVIGAAAFQAAEEELDLLELTADSKLRAD